MNQKKKTVQSEAKKDNTPWHNRKTPLLLLVGAGGIAASVAILQGCDSSPGDSVVQVERVRYATRETCLADWNNSDDCQFVEGVSAAAVAQAASDASDTLAASPQEASRTGHAGGGGHGGGHGGSGHGSAGG